MCSGGPACCRAGRDFDARLFFDNSSTNKRNPDPTAFVKYGTATTDEMFFGAFELGRPIEPADNTLAYAGCGVAVGAFFLLRNRIINAPKACSVRHAGGQS
jgi:hypothetical protein